MTSPVKEGFAVQLGSFSKTKPSLTLFDHLRDLGSIYLVEEANLYKVRLGLFSDKQKAQFYLKAVKKRGHDKAFVVKDKASGLLGNVKMHVTEKRFVANNYLEEDERSVKVIPNYKIRLASYNDPNWFKIENFSKSKYGTYLEQVKRGERTIFYLSGFVGKFSALEMLNEVKKLGFNDAYIIEEKNGEELRVKI